MSRPQKDPFQIAMADPRFRLLTLAEAGFWMHLVHMLMASPTPGYLRFLASVPASVSRWVSCAEPISETQAETQLATFCTLGLIEIDPCENSIALVGAKDMSRRAQAARNNGLLGGRTRKGETLDERRSRLQGSLLLPISGSTETKAETQPKPNEESSCAVPTTTTGKHTSGGSGTVREETRWVLLAQELAGLAGIQLRQISRDTALVAEWRAAGISPEGMRRAVQEVASRRHFVAGEVRTLRYFDQAVREAAGISQPQPSPAAAAQAEAVSPAVTRDAEGLTQQDRAKLEEWLGMVRAGVAEIDQRRIKLQTWLREQAPQAWRLAQAELQRQQAA